jgi:hypothetical protein
MNDLLDPSCCVSSSASPDFGGHDATSPGTAEVCRARFTHDHRNGASAARCLVTQSGIDFVRQPYCGAFHGISLRS